MAGVERGVHRAVGVEELGDGEQLRVEPVVHQQLRGKGGSEHSRAIHGELEKN